VPARTDSGRTSTAVASATLRERLDALPELARLARGGSGVVAGVPSGSIGLIAWWLRETMNRTILVVSSESERVYADSLVWSGGTGSAIFPAGDTPPFDRVPPSEEVTRARLATLMRLHSRAEPLLVVASPRGLLRPTLSRSVVDAGLTEVKRGARLPRDQLVGRLVELGYRRESAVSVPGDFAVRGGIVDVFGVDRARPWRAEWFGDDVEDLRVFDPATQESIAKLEVAQVWPARELDLMT
jgi:transcription-repair coupling factor (superfamily II helicase)